MTAAGPEGGVVWLDEQPPPRQPATRRVGVRSLLLGLLALAVIAGAVAWFARADVRAPDYPVLPGLDAPPSAMVVSLAEGAGLVLLGDGLVGTFAYDDPTAPLTVIDYNEGGRELWSSTDLWRADAANVWAIPLEGTDLLAAMSDTTVTLAKRSTGEITRTLELGPDQGALATTTQGTPLLYSATASGLEISLLGSFDPDDVRWTASLPAQGITSSHWIERDGLLMMPHDGEPTGRPFAWALDIDTGEHPLWSDEGIFAFQPLGENFLVYLPPGEYGPLDGAEGDPPPDNNVELRRPDGAMLWALSMDRGLTVLGGQRLFGLTGMGAETEVQAYDPATGEELWDEPAQVQATSLMWMDDKLLALSTFPMLDVRELDPLTGRVLSEHTYSDKISEGGWAIHQGEGKLIAAYSAHESELMAIRPGRAEPLWSQTYPGVMSIFAVDGTLLGSDTSTGSILVLR